MKWKWSRYVSGVFDSIYEWNEISEYESNTIWWYLWMKMICTTPRYEYVGTSNENGCGSWLFLLLYFAIMMMSTVVVQIGCLWI